MIASSEGSFRCFFCRLEHGGVQRLEPGMRKCKCVFTVSRPVGEDSASCLSSPLRECVRLLDLYCLGWLCGPVVEPSSTNEEVGGSTLGPC